MEEIDDNIVRMVLEWAIKRNESDDIFLANLNRSWAAVLDGGWRVT